MSAKKININISEDRHCNEFESIGSIFRPIIKDALASVRMRGYGVVSPKKEDIILLHVRMARISS